EVVALLELAKELECPNLTLQPGGPIAGEDNGAVFDRTQAHLAELGPLAKARGVTLSVEGHQGSLLEKPGAALRMMESLWPDVGFTYDPSHWAMQRIPLIETEQLLSYTHHVHVRNAKPGAMQALMAEGTVDFEWLVEALREHAYTGAVAIEYFNGFDANFEETQALRDRLLALGVDAAPEIES
ncbi:MAG: sugar phosphate isomerase/epimerase family protein, partial [Anaerolineae bacterium]